MIGYPALILPSIIEMAPVFGVFLVKPDASFWIVVAVGITYWPLPFLSWA